MAGEPPNRSAYPVRGRVARPSLSAPRSRSAYPARGSLCRISPVLEKTLFAKKRSDLQDRGCISRRFFKPQRTQRTHSF